MTDPLPILSAVISITDKLVKLAGTIKNDDLKTLLADLKLEIAQTKTTMADLINENRQLKATIRNHETPKLIPAIKGGVYYFDDNGPFCPACFDSNNKQNRLTRFTGGNTILGKYHCQICKARYGDGEIVQSQITK